MIRENIISIFSLINKYIRKEMIIMKEIIKSNLQPVDVAKVLNIDKQIFASLPQYIRIKLIRLVYSGQIFKYNDKE